MSTWFFLLHFLLNNSFLFVTYVKHQTFPQPLTKDEEAMFIDQLLAGDDQARDKLIEHNLRLVAHLVKKYEKKQTNQDDLISIGIIGLIKAIDTFHPNKGTKLATYAARCIENEILMHFRQQKKRSKETSLEEPIGHDKDGHAIALLDVLTSPTVDLDEQLQQNNDLVKIKKYFPLLDDREKKVLMLRFGLGNHTEQTQKNIAKTLNISRSYVSRIEKRALFKLFKAYQQDIEAKQTD
ncbi:RNA polymerase sigma-28 factor [Halolactibacillus miurensis]|uniref:RNA polymerase sigma factor n=2 Tax=Halolactibacillus miurensis TaxID=306541 RepID=A0ABQ0VRG8_9BACI|nr:MULTISPECIES: RNA polymerase sporulation sigma factor SigK [Halolactibacillus]GEM03741.1 RNA polymerase sigma-28 factor [Halolactibacillus miurensis]